MGYWGRMNHRSSLMGNLADHTVSLCLGVFVMMERLHPGQPNEADQAHPRHDPREQFHVLFMLANDPSKRRFQAIGSRLGV